MSNDNPPVDHVIADEREPREESKLEKNLKTKSTWLRLVFMVIFYLIAGLAALVASAVVVLGFFWVLFTGEANAHLKRFGAGLAAYISEIVSYLTYNSETKPFPFEGDWPSANSEETSESPSESSDS